MSAAMLRDAAFLYVLLGWASPALSQGAASQPVAYIDGIQPVMDHETYLHGLLDEFEGRYGADGSQFRYDGEAWYGTDYNRLWLKSEGTVQTNGQLADGDHELLYDRPISTYFDLQGGLRLDIDHGPARSWAAFGVEGLALYFFKAEATLYAGAHGVAGRLQGSYDLLLTNRLILQPQIEMNFYSQADRARQVGSGLAEIDAGLRLRYEWHRKLAPYLGVTWNEQFGGYSPAEPHGARFTFGLRSWF